MRDIRYLLTAWGNWSGSRIGTEYKAAWPLATASSDIRPMLSDADGETVDRAVGRLKHFDPLGYDIVVAYYKGKASCRAIGQELGKPTYYITGFLARAEAYIAGSVAELLEAA
ncbi:antiterminator Q family protein [Symbiopectobacterium sp. Eva_TO]